MTSTLVSGYLFKLSANRTSDPANNRTNEGRHAQRHAVLSLLAHPRVIHQGVLDAHGRDAANFPASKQAEQEAEHGDEPDYEGIPRGSQMRDAASHRTAAEAPDERAHASEVAARLRAQQGLLLSRLDAGSRHGAGPFPDPGPFAVHATINDFAAEIHGG